LNSCIFFKFFPFFYIKKIYFLNGRKKKKKCRDKIKFTDCTVSQLKAEIRRLNGLYGLKLKLSGKKTELLARVRKYTDGYIPKTPVKQQNKKTKKKKLPTPLLLVKPSPVKQKKTWSSVLNDWENGIIPRFPNNYTFLWRTSPYTYGGNKEYKEEFVKDSGLPQNQNPTPFSNRFQEDKDKNVLAFWNNTNNDERKADTRLVVPALRTGKNLKNIHEFNLSQGYILYYFTLFITG